MTPCTERGCRNLATICKDCGRIVCEKTFKAPGEWVSVKDQMPPRDRYQRLITDGKHVSLGCPTKLGWVAPIYFEREVTHWMELPEPPK